MFEYCTRPLHARHCPLAQLLPDQRRACAVLPLVLRGLCAARRHRAHGAGLRLRRRRRLAIPHRAAGLGRQALHRDGARRARHRVLPVLRARARPGDRMGAPPDRLPRLDRTTAPGRQLPRLPAGAHALGQRAAMGAHHLQLRPCGLHLRHRLRRLLRQRAFRRDARRAARAAGNRRGLRHVAPAGVLARAGAADVGLRAARPQQHLDDPDQGHAAAVPARHPGYRLLGARAWRHAHLGLPVPAPPTGGCGTSSGF